MRAGEQERADEGGPPRRRSRQPPGVGGGARRRARPWGGGDLAPGGLRRLRRFPRSGSALPARGAGPQRDRQLRPQGAQGKKGKPPTTKSPQKWLAFRWRTTTSPRRAGHLRSLPEQIRLGRREARAVGSRQPGQRQGTPRHRRPTSGCASWRWSRPPTSSSAGTRTSRSSERWTGWFINPGSVGRPDDGDPRASYAILQLAAPFRCATTGWLTMSHEPPPRSASRNCPRRSPRWCCRGAASMPCCSSPPRKRIRDVPHQATRSVHCPPGPAPPRPRLAGARAAAGRARPGQRLVARGARHPDAAIRRAEKCRLLHRRWQAHACSIRPGQEPQHPSLRDGNARAPPT